MSYCLHIYASFSPIRSPIWTTEICLWPAPLGRNTSYCKFFKIKIQENLLKGTNGKKRSENDYFDFKNTGKRLLKLNRK
jgi:hypothetical protein